MLQAILVLFILLKYEMIKPALIISCCLLLIASCISDVPYKEGRIQLEKNTNIVLPTPFSVLREEFHEDMDYEIVYDLKFTTRSSSELVKGINNSGHFDPNLLRGADNFMIGNEYAFCSLEEGIWNRTARGYEFAKQNHGTWFYVDYDTATFILKYQELGD